MQDALELTRTKIMPTVNRQGRVKRKPLGREQFEQKVRFGSVRFGSVRFDFYFYFFCLVWFGSVRFGFGHTWHGFTAEGLHPRVWRQITVVGVAVGFFLRW